jgi:hypothetical protein
MGAVILNDGHSTFMVLKYILHISVLNFLIYVEFDIKQVFLYEIFLLDDPS